MLSKVQLSLRCRACTLSSQSRGVAPLGFGSEVSQLVYIEELWMCASRYTVTAANMAGQHTVREHTELYLNASLHSTIQFQTFFFVLI